MPYCIVMQLSPDILRQIDALLKFLFIPFRLYPIYLWNSALVFLLVFLVSFQGGRTSISHLYCILIEKL